jgi:hypothetical protein
MTKKFTVTAFVAILALCVLVAGLRWYVRTHTMPSENACINNLRVIDGAKQQWGLEHYKTTNDPTWDDLRPYFSRGGKLPVCPHGGTYTIGRRNENPKCSYPGHTLE